MSNLTQPWLKAYPADVPHHVVPTAPRLDALLDHAVQRWPTRTALGFMGRSWTYAEVHNLAETVARALQAFRLKPGDRVALCLPNCPAYVAAFFGVLKAGGVVVNLNPLYSADELHHMLADSGATHVFGLALEPVWSKLMQARRGTRVRHVIAVDLATFMPLVTRLGFYVLKASLRVYRLPHGTMAWAHFLARAERPLQRHRRTLRHAAVLQYTGGTTGTPKAAVLTHGSLLANTAQVTAWLGKPHPHGDVMVAVLPLFHVFALTAILLMGVNTGATLHLLPQFHLKNLLKRVERTRATLLPGVPALFNALANSPLTRRYSLKSLRFCISGGAPLPVVVKQRFEALSGATVVEGYGLTEASPVVACGPHTGTAPAGSVGLPLPGTAVSIRAIDNPTKVLPAGADGEIWLQGPQTMARYWRRPAATNALMHNGWMRTGDVGHFDRHGFLFVTDRLKDVIFVNGYKVFPRHVEEILARHPAVAEVAVVAIPHPHKGEMPTAFVSLRTPEPSVLKALQTYADTHLNPLEKLADITVLDALPKTLVGKIDKKPLRAMARTHVKG